MDRQRQSRFTLILFGSVLILALCGIWPGSALGEPKFMGTGSCSSSNCHGSTTPRKGNNVIQNEYVTWSKHDKHSKAWSVLTESDSKRIAENLGLADPSKEKLCLDCHSTYVSDPALKGERYTVEDGVSCEGCHGAAEKWLSSHTESSESYADNIKKGMRDIVPVQARAELCISCHYGTDDKTVNHKLIGAGHPRLSFELDTFGMIQPKHWDYDEDYIKRKGAYDPIRAWLIGQNVLAIESLSALLSDKRSHDGIWPELTLFNCYSCHHSLKEDQWRKRDYSKRPGELKLNVSSLHTVREALSVLNSEISMEVGELMLHIYDNYKDGRAGEDIKSLKALLQNRAMDLFNSRKFTEDDAQKLILEVVEYSSEIPHLQYEEAEQLTMGIAAASSFDPAIAKQHKPAIDALYTALRDPESFVAEEFTAAAEKFRKGLSR